MSAGSLAINPIFHAHTKHIEMDIHFVCDHLVIKKLVVHYVPTDYQAADIFTKMLPSTPFLLLWDKLNLCLPPSNPRKQDRK